METYRIDLVMSLLYLWPMVKVDRFFEPIYIYIQNITNVNQTVVSFSLIVFWKLLVHHVVIKSKIQAQLLNDNSQFYHSNFSSQNLLKSQNEFSFH